MTNNQYKNIIKMTLNDKKDDNMAPLEFARAIMNNCGVALPNGTISDVAKTLNTNDYMGWRKCTAAQAMEYANAGTPVIGIDANHVTVISPAVEAEADQRQDTAIATKANVVSTSALSVENPPNTQYYAYYADTTTTAEVEWTIKGIPEQNVYVGQMFTLYGINTLSNTTDVTWNYDENKFCAWTEVMYHNYFTHFQALSAGQTTIQGIFNNEIRSINITITAPCTVTYDTNGGSVLPETRTAYENVITLPTPTYDDDHIFMGWFTATDNTEKIGDDGTQYVVTSSTTLHAQWLFLRQRFLTRNACYIANENNVHIVRGIMVHSTAADNSSIGRYVPWDEHDDGEDNLLKKHSGRHWNTYHADCKESSYDNEIHTYEETNDRCKTCGGKQTCVHAFIGKLKDGRVAVYQTLPWEIPGWHSGSFGNNSADDQGYIGFEICEDETDDEYFKAAYHEAVKLCAYLCKVYGETIFEDGKPINEAIISHKEGHDKMKFASGHGDPDHWFNPKGYTMDDFRQAVQNMRQ